LAGAPFASRGDESREKSRGENLQLVYTTRGRGREIPSAACRRSLLVRRTQAGNRNREGPTSKPLFPRDDVGP
jgi:hypothetical protein